MANVTNDIPMNGIGQDGRRFHTVAETAADIYAGTMVAQLSTGTLVAATTAGAGPVIGKATHTVTAATAGQRVVVETDRIFALANGSSGDACSEATPIGAPVYALDDHTVADNDNSGTLQVAGTFQGMEPDGKVRVKITPESATTGALRVQAGRGTFAAGVLAVEEGITVTAASRVFASRVTEAGTDGDEIRCPDADRTVGGPGTGALTFRAFSGGSAATSDTSTFDYLIVG
jgi:hypothetical protein